MLFREFCQEHSITDNDIQKCQAKHDYKDHASVKAKYLHLSKEVDGQDYLIMSYNAAMAIENGTIGRLGDLEAKRGDNGKWSLIMPARHETWQVDIKL